VSDDVLNLFSGAGGWEEGALRLGMTPLGIELDATACATARAAGHECVHADVAAVVVEHGGMSLDDHEAQQYRRWIPGYVDGLIGSPPCQAYSRAGKGGGRLDLDRLICCAHELAVGHDTRAMHRAECVDERSLLVVEPLRWALALRPSWIALEQVPDVLPLWSLFAHLLAAHGYHTWTGVLNAADYAVPQTRRRAILIASLDGPVGPPPPSHSDQRKGMCMLGLEPWISMGDALGWTDRTTGHETARGAGMRERRGERRLPSPDEPSQVVTGKTRSWLSVPARTICGHRVPRWAYDRPAPTLTTTARHEEGLLVYPRWRNGNQERAAERALDEPAPTIHFGNSMNEVRWVFERPATTVQGNPRVGRPDHKDRDAVPVTLEEAAILQGFPPDYPWQGTKTQRSTQVGNAVPPPFARAVLAEAVRSSLKKREAAA
jgi:DNA (cytosine-5)-methyltransferase 1